MIDTKYIREKILDLAVRGKLVDQDPKDGDARDLLDIVSKDALQLSKIKKVKYTIKEPVLSARNHSYFDALPKNWAIASISQIALNYDKFRKPVNKKERLSRIEEKPIDELFPYYGSTGLTGYIDDYKLDERTLLMGEDAAPFLEIGKQKSYIVEGKYWVNNHAHILKPLINDMYLKYYLDVFDYKGYVSGTTRLKLTQTSLQSIPVAIPPLAEQERIVEKIEESFALLDEIEEAQDQIRILGEQIKSKVLDMAVRGELVPQDSSDGNAKDLLKEIQAEKEELIKTKKIKKEKKLPEIREEEIPFEIPDSWVWVRLGDYVTLINGDRSSNYPKISDLVTEGVPFFGAADMTSDKLDFSNVRFISEDKFNTLNSGKLEDYDLVTLLRGSVGKTSLFRKNNEFVTGFINVQMVILRELIKTDSSVLYLKFFLNSIYFINFSEKYKSGTAVSQMPATTLRNVLFPLPSLDEQKRIVEKIEEIFAAVDAMID